MTKIKPVSVAPIDHRTALVLDDKHRMYYVMGLNEVNQNWRQLNPANIPDEPLPPEPPVVREQIVPAKKKKKKVAASHATERREDGDGGKDGE